MNCRRQPNRSARGFTLLEVLLATAVMSVIALSVYSALRIAFRARDSAMASVGPARSAELAMNVVSQDVESALWPTGTLAGAFIGGPGQDIASTDQLEFYAVLPDSAATSVAMSNSTVPNMGASNLVGAIDPTTYAGVCRIDILVRQLATDTEPVLVRRITRNLLSTTDPSYEDQVLCRGVKTFTVAYLDGQQNSYDTWDSTQQGDSLPLCVQITLELQQPESADPAASASADNTYLTTHIVTLSCYRDTQQGGGAP